MATKSNTDNNKEFAPLSNFDTARQRLQFELAIILAKFEAEWGAVISRVRINRETEDDYGTYTKLSSVSPYEGVTSFISDVTVEFSRAELVSPNRVEEAEQPERDLTPAEQEAVEELAALKAKV